MARRPSDPPHPSRRPRPEFGVEAGWLAAGARAIAGCDEAGRGPLAGPVVAAAVILDAQAIPDGLDDSKRLSRAAREAAFADILRTARAVAFASVGAAAIDRTDIRAASLLAMRRAVAGLDLPPDHVLVDGRDVPPGLACGASAIVGGDGLSLSIAAASIVAKVTRDAMMRRADALFPGYGFAAHVGYGTAAHRAAILRLGPSALHRMSFRPLSETSGPVA